MAALPGLIAHGGVWGAIAEASVAVAVIAFFAAIWQRERRARRRRSVEVSEPDDR